MTYDSKKEKLIEWPARILLTIHFIRSISGLLVYWQTKFQLTSPFIPESVITEISVPYFKAGLIVSLTFIISIWFYFFRMKLVVISISAISILAFQLLAIYFAK